VTSDNEWSDDMAQPAWIAGAWADLGVREWSGAADNPRIVAYYRDLGHGTVTHDEVAWCAAFVGASLERASVASTRSLLARSYLGWGHAIDKGRLGAVAVFSRGPDQGAGHVGFYLDRDATRVFVLGGNQSDAVTVTAIESHRLLGLRWPSLTMPTDDGPDSGPDFGPVSGPSGTLSVGATPASTLFAHCLAHVLLMEGGWTDDPYDPGGPTNFGITLGTLALHRRVSVDAATVGRLRDALRQISSAEIREIYLARYWTRCRADALAPGLALMHFDAAVNHGVGTAARMLQEAAGAEPDGELGADTLKAIGATDTGLLIQRYADLRRARYRRLGHFWRFGRGWLARVDKTLAAAQRLLTPRMTTPEPKGDQTMTTNTQIIGGSAASGSAKWWGQSMTVWGALITAASTVVPVLGPVIGIDITPEVVRQLGTQAIQVTQALGGIAGTLMTLYGRFRAVTTLERRAVTVQL
jgi:uncharacterized protein (TIGR02594 family)